MKSYSRILVAFILVVIFVLPISIFGVSAAQVNASDVALRMGYHFPLYTDTITNGEIGANDIMISNPNLFIGSGNGTPLIVSRDDVAQTFSIAPNVNGLQAGLIIPLTAQDYGLSVLGTLKTNDINASASTIYSNVAYVNSSLIASFANIGGLFVGGSGPGVLMSVDGSAQTFSIVSLSYGNVGLTMPLTNQGYGLSVLGTLRTDDVSVSGSVNATGAVNAGSVTASGALNGASLNVNTVSATGAVNAGSVTASGALNGASLNVNTANTGKLFLGGSEITINGDKICFYSNNGPSQVCSTQSATCSAGSRTALADLTQYPTEQDCLANVDTDCDTACKGMVKCSGTNTDGCTGAGIVYYQRGKTTDNAQFCKNVQLYGDPAPEACVCYLDNSETYISKTMKVSQSTSGTYCATGVLQ